MSISLCPATGCPVIGISESEWTGETNSDCPENHEDCGWWDARDDECLAGNENGFNLFQFWEEEHGPLPDNFEDIDFPKQKPECGKEDICQWQKQSGDIPCPPRLAVMMDLDPKVTLF